MEDLDGSAILRIYEEDGEIKAFVESVEGEELSKGFSFSLFSIDNPNHRTPIISSLIPPSAKFLNDKQREMLKDASISLHADGALRDVKTKRFLGYQKDLPKIENIIHEVSDSSQLQKDKKQENDALLFFAEKIAEKLINIEE